MISLGTSVPLLRATWGARSKGLTDTTGQKTTAIAWQLLAHSLLSSASRHFSWVRRKQRTALDPRQPILSHRFNPPPPPRPSSRRGTSAVSFPAPVFPVLLRALRSLSQRRRRQGCGASAGVEKHTSRWTS